MNILIQSPSYVQASGGIRVLHYLGYLCHTLGHRVKMACDILNPQWGNYSRDSNKYDLRILPEIYPVTFKDGINTVRWVLYFPGKLCGGPTNYPDYEYVVSYCDAYLEACKEAANKKTVKTFFLPYLDMIGINDDLPRENLGVVWYGKGPMITPPEISGYPIITRSWPSPRFKLIHLLKSTLTLYSFDAHTAINEEALICGCDVMLWDGKEFKHYCEKNPERAIMNMSEDIILVSKFLELLQKHFGIIDKQGC